MNSETPVKCISDGCTERGTVRTVGECTLMTIRICDACAAKLLRQVKKRVMA